MQELMKKIVYAIAALALIFTGCAKELDNSTKDNFSKVRLHVKVADQLTKVSADNDGRYHWQGGDRITVFNHAGNKFEFFTENGGSDVDFGATSWSGNLGDYAMYPASNDHVVVGNEISFRLPDSFAWAENSTNMPMLGKISGDVATFKAVGGVLKLVCYNIPSGAAKLWFVSSSSRITGDFEIADASVANPVIASESATDDVLEIAFAYSANKVFYIPLPTGEIDGFEVQFLDGSDNELFSKSTDASFTVGRNQMIIAPALNCSAETIVWYEAFSGYSANTTFSSAAIITTGEHEAVGNASITYTTYSPTATNTRVYSDNTAGGTSPEIIIQKNGGYFKAANISVSGESTLTLDYYTNNDALSVSTTNTSDVSFSSVSSTGKKRTRTVTIADPSKTTTFDIIFTTPSSDNIRLDNVKLFIPGTAATTPSLSAASTDLTIAVGSLTQTTTVTYSNPVDALGISCVVNEEAKSWLSASITGSTLTVTASGVKDTAGDREGTVTLKATGVADVSVTVTQPSAFVAKPSSLDVTADEDYFYVKWAADQDNATGYTAYISTDDDLSDYALASHSYSATGPAAGKWTATIPKADVVGTNYVYVVLTSVAANHVAESGHIKKALVATSDHTVTWTIPNKDALGAAGSTGTISTTNAGESLSYNWTYKRTNVSGSGYTGTGLTNGYLQIGSSSTVENLEFTTTNIPGVIKSVTVNCASYNNAHNVAITVGDNTYLAKTATPKWSSNTGGDKTGSGTSSGKITISFTDGTRAMYIKSITVVYNN